MRNVIKYIMLCLAISSCSGSAQEVTLTAGGNSVYSIVLPVTPTKLETRSAKVLQDYMKRVSGAMLPIVNEQAAPAGKGIYVGYTRKAGQVVPGKLPDESYKVMVRGSDVVMCAGNGRGLIYGVYNFIEQHLGCKKISAGPALTPHRDKITVPADLDESGRPSFIYRESYYPGSADAEYLEWHQLQRFEDLWGLWGHSFNKLVPAKTYFKQHPEYYAEVKGVRQPTQLCLSNEDVFTILTSELQKRITANPDAMYWSVSPNDDIGYCECSKCRAVDHEQGSQAGSLIRFVNRVAAKFPDVYITTLAYGYTHRAPKNLRPADNVYIFLSTIDAYRNKPLATEGSAAVFRSDLKGWRTLTSKLFVWDYVTQFTNYLAPFPNLLTLQPNIKYFRDNCIKGVFSQGSGDTYGEWAELRDYLVAEILRDDNADVKALTAQFLEEYYGPAAKFLLPYIGQTHGNMEESKRNLDIYGNPVNEWNAWLSPKFLDDYSQLMDDAEAAVENKPIFAERVMRARLPLEYTVLQQARFYGLEKFGVWVQNDKGDWEIKANLKEKVARFVANCRKAGVKELSEGGPSPDQYQAEWNGIFANGVTPSIARGGTVALQYPFAPEYPAKGNRTLVDGTPGYSDFSYNWLCFYGTDMVATIDMGKEKNVTGFKMHFLDDPRHWIFLPLNIKIAVSENGSDYKEVANIAVPQQEEHYQLDIRQFAAEARVKARYVRVTATNLPALPEWRYREHKKPMIACDEIFVQ